MGSSGQSMLYGHARRAIRMYAYFFCLTHIKCGVLLILSFLPNLHRLAGPARRGRSSSRCNNSTGGICCVMLLCGFAGAVWF